MKQKKKGNRRKQGRFNPDREYINKAIEEYLKKGGTIEKINISENVLKIIQTHDDAADKFLLGFYR